MECDRTDSSALRPAAAPGPRYVDIPVAYDGILLAGLALSGGTGRRHPVPAISGCRFPTNWKRWHTTTVTSVV